MKYLTEECRYGWHTGNPLEMEGGSCLGHDEDGRCTCKCHKDERKNTDES